jgi:hypothetical protein
LSAQARTGRVRLRQWYALAFALLAVGAVVAVFVGGGGAAAPARCLEGASSAAVVLVDGKLVSESGPYESGCVR